MGNLSNFRGESFAANFDITVRGYRVTGSVNASRDLRVLDIMGEVQVGEDEQPVNFNCFRRDEKVRANIYNIDIEEMTDFVAIVNDARLVVEDDVKTAIGAE